MKKNIFIGSLVVILLLIVLTSPSTYFLHNGVFNKYESSFLGPLFFLVTATGLSTFILLFFCKNIFSNWLKYFFVWYLPVAVILALTLGNDNNIVAPTKENLAMIAGQLMVVVTLVFALAAKFIFKVK